MWRSHRVELLPGMTLRTFTGHTNALIASSNVPSSRRSSRSSARLVGSVGGFDDARLGLILNCSEASSVDPRLVPRVNSATCTGKFCT